MIELLVAVIILAIGILGVAGLQTTGVKNNYSAMQRTQAVYLAQQFAEIVRSNPAQLDAGYFGNGGTTAEATIYPKSPAPTKTAACYAAGCSSAQMVASQLVDWKANLEDLLPNGTATVYRKGDLFRIQINWADKKDAIDNFTDFGDDVDADSKAQLTNGFNMSFRP